MHPIRMTDDLPQRWIIKGANKAFADQASPGESFAFQIGVYPISLNLDNVRIRFSELRNGQASIPAKTLFSCLNTDGTGWDAKPVKKQVSCFKKVRSRPCGAWRPFLREPRPGRLQRKSVCLCGKCAGNGFGYYPANQRRNA